MNTWTGDGDEDQADEHEGPLCVNCLRRPARPGSPYCGRLCRWLDAGRRLRLLALPGAVLAAAAVLALVAVACTSTAGSVRVTASAPSSASLAAPAIKRCAWYTVTNNDGQNVVVTATGAACGDPPIVDWLATLTRRTWISTGYVHGTCIAQLGRAGVTLRIYEAGWARPTEETAGYLADDLVAAGWHVQQAPGGGSGPPPLPTPIGAA